MRETADKFLTPDERLEIEEHIARAEKLTSGEIVVMVVPASYHYPLASLLGSLFVALLLGIAAAILSGNETMWFFLAVFGLSFMVLHELFKRTRSLRRLFVSAPDMKAEVDEAAFTAFYQRNINRTVDHTGILLFISLFEHSVRVIADRGINEKVTQDVWQEIVDTIITGIHHHEPANAVAAAVDRCAAILASHFPLKQGDRNELSNRVIIG